MAFRVGVIGGGQLARMMVPAAVELGIDLAVLAEAPDAAARIAATVVGDCTDVDTVLAFASGVDVITFDHEHVPQAVVAALVDAGVAVRPGPEALRHAQDKLVLRERLEALEIPQPAWSRVEVSDDLGAFLDGTEEARAIVKTPRGGYDGKGVRLVRTAGDADDWLQDGPLLAEEFVPFRRELAQLVARRPSGEIVAWPLVETVQAGGICREVVAPAPRSAGRIADVACDLAMRLAEALDVTGVLAIEVFATLAQRVLVNELPMRPQNSGHWTIAGPTPTQFEQHLRAVLDLPLGATGSHEP